MAEQIEICTDHKNLAYFCTTQKLNHHQAHWSLYLSCFHFSLIHQPGNQMGKPDDLSCHPDHPQGHKDNSEVVLLDPSIFEVHCSETTLVNGPEADLLDQICQSKDLDKPVVKALQELDAGNIQADEWEQEGDIILHQGQVYIPQDAQLWANILQAHHNSPTAGHPGCWKTLELVSRNY